jgi:hypothetical protein
MIYGKQRPVTLFLLNSMTGLFYGIWLFGAVTRSFLEIIVVGLFIGS